ncbi:MAG: hypothetical protein WC140_01325 [Bacteroidales bacterium]
MISPIYHICNKSPRIIFRTKEDYFTAINRLASVSHQTKSEILAFAIMSTHFHILLRTLNYEKFVKHYSTSYTKWFNAKYQYKGKLFNIGKTDIKANSEILNCADYIHQNPIHHNICSTALQYLFSSANSYFHDDIICENYFEENTKPVNKKASELKNSTYRKMFGHTIIPNEWEIINESLILPSTFLETKTLTHLYRNARSYINHINKPLNKEIEFILIKNYKYADIKSKMKQESFKSQTYSEYYNYDEHITKANRVTDIRICTFIERYIKAKNLNKTFIYLTPSEKENIWTEIRKHGVSRSHFLRCINF